MKNKMFDVCIIADRESDRLDSYVYENLRNLKVIQCYNFSLKKYFKTNYHMTIEEQLKFEAEVSFNVGFYDNIIKNSEFVFFDTSVFNINYIMLHLGIAIGLNKPIIMIDKNSDNNRGKFSIGIHNKLNSSWASDEIERKWLISENLYNELINIPQSIQDWIPVYTTKISQFIDDNGIRYRKQNASRYPQYIKCVKSDKDEFTRFEIESVIDKTMYENKLAEFKESTKYTSVINKDRFTVNIRDVVLELNKHKIGSHYFYTAEIEYANKSRIREIDLSTIIKENNICNGLLDTFFLLSFLR